MPFSRRSRPGLGEADAHLPFVRGIALAAQITHGLELFQDRRERVGFQEHLFAKLAHRLAVLLPQGDDRDPLRVGQAEILKALPVGPAEGEVGRVDRKAQEIAKAPLARGRLRFLSAP